MMVTMLRRLVRWPGLWPLLFGFALASALYYAAVGAWLPVLMLCLPMLLAIRGQRRTPLRPLPRR